MYVHWKTLFGFGFIFWLLLCLNEILGGGKPYRYFELNEFDEIYDRKFVESLTVTKEVTTPATNLQQRGIKLGLSLLVWNTIAFVFSILFCSLAKTVSWIMWKVKIYYRNNKQITVMRTISGGNLTERSSINVSKIPVMIKSNSTMARSSDSNIKVIPPFNSDSSCPNLSPLKRSSSSISQSTVTKNCQTLFRNTNVFPIKGNKLQDHLENQYFKMKEEFVKLQANSLKEHAILSKKVESVTKEKREISKQLMMAQKENRAAKHQLEELLQEKAALVRRLENATKEFKCNTKTKKFALAKLEEVTATVEDLKQQLEQVTRDKEILENKLRVLECEYEKLQERLILTQSHENFIGYHEHTPERDMNGKDPERRQNFTANQSSDGKIKQSPNTLCTVSQTELDMKKIEIKIKQLERNLENFNATKSEFNFRADREESDLSLSVRSNQTDSQIRTDEDADVSENPFLNSPRFRYWGGRAGDLVGRKDQFAKIQALATRMHEKGRFLENIKESCESTQGTDPEDCSSPESLEDLRPPKRIVSSSAAFQNFLKSLHSSESMRKSFGSQSDLYF